MRRALYGESGYGLELMGSEESVTALRMEHLRALYEKLVIPNNCLLAIYGDIRAGDTKDRVEQQLGQWCKGPAILSDEAVPTVRLSEVRRVSETRDK